MSIQPPTRQEIEHQLGSVPIFPLPGVVFLPSSLLPLHVFEPRYRDLVRDALAGSGLFAVPQLLPGWQTRYQGTPDVHAIAGLGQIVRHQDLDDGRYNIILHGVGRVRILAENPVDTRYRQVRATLLADLRPSEAELHELVGQVRALGSSLVQAKPELAGALARVGEGFRDPVRYIDSVAHLVLTDPETRQSYLEADDVVERVGMVETALATVLAGGASVEA